MPFYAHLEEYDEDLNNPFGEDSIKLYTNWNDVPEGGYCIYEFKAIERIDLETEDGLFYISFDNFQRYQPVKISSKPVNPLSVNKSKEKENIYASRFRGNANKDTKDQYPDTKDQYPDTKDQYPDTKDQYLSLRKIHIDRTKEDPERGLRYYSFRMSYSDNEAKIIDGLKAKFNLPLTTIIRKCLHILNNSSSSNQFPDKF